MATFILLLIGFFASVVFYEIDFFKDSILNQLYELNFLDYSLYLIYFTSFLAIFTISASRYYNFQYNKSIKNDTYYFFFSDNCKKLIFEIIAILILPYKLFDFTFQNFNYEEKIVTFYTLNQIQCFFMLFRLIIMVNIVLKNLPYSSVRMNRIMKISNVEESTLFIIKCLIKKRPYQFFITSLIISILIFSYGIRICELPLTIKLESPGLQSYLTTLWMVMITMTTVGYGDYQPKTIPGRTLGFVLCIWGVFLMSMIVIILFNSLELSFEEKQALLIFNKLEAKKPLADVAARLIAKMWRLRKEKNPDPQQIFILKKQFQELQKELRNVDSIQFDYFFEQLNIYFQNINNNIQKLNHIQLTLLKLKDELDDINNDLEKEESFEVERISEVSDDSFSNKNNSFTS